METSFSSSIINLSYSEILKQIYQLPKSAAGERSLANMERFCSYLGHPERAFPVIHVAGTNGKGSVCTKIAAALGNEGYRCGLYTSPHISSFCERIQINSALIPEEEICRLYPQVMEAISACGLNAAFFEIATLLAFLYFRENNVEIAVIETGLGGLYDATNVVLPLVSVITSIGFDHKEILGSTLKEICLAKAGIIKPNTPVVLGKRVSSAWIFPIATAKKSPLAQTTLSHPGYDEENRATARLALGTISKRFPIGAPALEKGLQTKPPCRFEQRKLKGKELILDVAHNPQGFERLLSLLRHTYPNASFRFVCGFSKGKEIDVCANLIQNQASAIHLVSGDHSRLASTEEIAPYFHHKNVILENSIPQGINNACRASLDSEIIVITGSFFIMHETRQALEVH